MSALDPHIRVLRALAAAFHGQWVEHWEAAGRSASPGALAELAAIARMVSDGCRMAADEIEAEEREFEARMRG